MVEISSQRVEGGMKRIQSFLKTQLRKGKIDQGMNNSILSLITTHTDTKEAASSADHQYLHLMDI